MSVQLFLVYFNNLSKIENIRPIFSVPFSIFTTRHEI